MVHDFIIVLCILTFNLCIYVSNFSSHQITSYLKIKLNWLYLFSTDIYDDANRFMKDIPYLCILVFPFFANSTSYNALYVV